MTVSYSIFHCSVVSADGLVSRNLYASLVCKLKMLFACRQDSPKAFQCWKIWGTKSITGKRIQSRWNYFCNWIFSHCLSYPFCWVNRFQKGRLHVSLQDEVFLSKSLVFESLQHYTHWFPELLKLNQNVLDSGKAFLDVVQMDRVGYWTFGNNMKQTLIMRDNSEASGVNQGLCWAWLIF